MLGSRVRAPKGALKEAGWIQPASSRIYVVSLQFDVMYRIRLHRVKRSGDELDLGKVEFAEFETADFAVPHGAVVEFQPGHVAHGCDLRGARDIGHILPLWELYPDRDVERAQYAERFQ